MSDSVCPYWHDSNRMTIMVKISFKGSLVWRESSFSSVNFELANGHLFTLRQINYYDEKMLGKFFGDPFCHRLEEKKEEKLEAVLLDHWNLELGETGIIDWDTVSRNEELATKLRNNPLLINTAVKLVTRKQVDLLLDAAISVDAYSLTHCSGEDLEEKWSAPEVKLTEFKLAVHAHFVNLIQKTLLHQQMREASKLVAFKLLVERPMVAELLYHCLKCLKQQSNCLKIDELKSKSTISLGDYFALLPRGHTYDFVLWKSLESCEIGVDGWLHAKKITWESLQTKEWRCVYKQVSWCDDPPVAWTIADESGVERPAVGLSIKLIEELCNCLQLLK